MNNPNKYTLICFGSPWDDRQRRQYQIITRLSKWKKIEKTVYIESQGPLNLWSYIKYIFGKTEQCDTDRWRKLFLNGLVTNKGGLFVVTPIAIIPLISIPLILKLNLHIFYFPQIVITKWLLKKLKSKNIILWITHPYDTARFIGKFNEKLVFYDLCDDYKTFQPEKSIWGRIVKRNDDFITKKADSIFVVSKTIFKNKNRVIPNVHLVQNGVDISSYIEINKVHKINPEISKLKKPIIGYIGVIQNRINFGILEQIAINFPKWSLVMIGPVNRVVKNQVKNLRKYSNISFLGEKPYWEMPYYLSNMDVCIIPHKINPVTDNMNPIKLYEYLAAGKPIVSTAVAGVKRFSDVIEIASTKEEFLNSIQRAFENDNKERVRKRITYAKDNSWDKRVEQVKSVIEQCI